MEIEYVASPDLVEAVKGKAIRDEKGLYFINTDHAEPFLPVQLWTQGETESTSCWFPCIDRPDEKFTMKLSITVNKELQTLSNGKRIASEVQGNLRTDTWVSAQPMSAYLYMMAAGEFRVQTDSLTEPALDTIFFTRYDTLRPACTDDAGTEAAWVKEVPMFRVVNAQRDMLNGVGVSYYLEPEYAPFAKAIFKGTPEMIDFFSAKLGVPYPWDKYAQIVVRDYVSGAMENTSATLHGESVQKTPRELLDASNDDIIAHELFHQWFGDLVTCKSWSQLVLNEGFASFGEQLWIEYRYGEDAALVKRMQAINRYLGYSERVSDEAIVRYNYRHPDDMFTTITYQKGARVLQLLRQTLGDDAFFQGLKNYLTRFAFQAADLDDLRKEMEAVSGLDLKLFFRQWFETGGHPMLDIRYEFNDSTHRMAVVVEQKQSTETVYRFPLQFKVSQNNQSKLYTFDIQHRKEVFYVNQTDTSAFEMPNVTVDPYACFPGEINDHKSFVQHIQTYFGKGTIVEKVRALEAIKDMQKGNDTIQKVLLIALSDRKPFLRQKALEWISWKEKQVDSSLAQRI
ncbi:MAG TPA: M1 family metallopeptidase, partial [Chitinophagaceae bacterium]|nr:M1 family metallopeptidase [Chitinophagaceae bacterium]